MQTLAERNASIRRRWADGEKVAALAKEYGISRQRAHQIVHPTPTARRTPATPVSAERALARRRNVTERRVRELRRKLSVARMALRKAARHAPARIPAGSVVVDTRELRGVLSQAVMLARLAAIHTGPGNPTNVLVARLLPVIREGVQSMVASQSKGSAHV